MKHRYSKTSSAAKAHLDYVKYRPRDEHEEPRSIFDADGHISRSDALSMLNEHQNGNYRVHKLILSPSDHERPQDLERMTRYTMARLEQDKGQKLHWCAVVHRNTEHHHVHVVVAGAGERHTDGKTRSVWISREDCLQSAATGREYCRAVNALDRERDSQERTNTYWLDPPLTEKKRRRREGLLQEVDR